MSTANERMLNAEISHQINLVRYSNTVVRNIMRILNAVDADLFAQLAAALERMPPEQFTANRLNQLLESTRALNNEVYAKVGEELDTSLRQLAPVEAQFQHDLFTSSIPRQILAVLDIATVNPQQVYTAATARPFQGRLLKEWASSLAEGRMKRIHDNVAMGYVENQTVGQIVQRIRGTRANNYADGVISIDRRDAEAVARTAVSHLAGTTRDRFYEANDDLVKAVGWSSTLDGRTTDMCRLRDGLQYSNDDKHKPIGHKVPWLAGPGRIHWQCRSTSVPILKSWRELGLDIDEFAEGTRASMDGQVPASTTYAQWLKKQSAKVQDDILGPTRGKLFREGGLELDKFYNDKGKYLTLDELRARDAAAFKRADL